MKLPLYQVDAFTDRIFAGNPAAVVPLASWLPDPILQAIAVENNLSETAFVVLEGDRQLLRWFTPGGEVDLCGHATLATAHVLWTERGAAADELCFATRSGELRVRREAGSYLLDLPARPAEPVALDEPAAAALARALGGAPEAVLASEDWLVIYPEQGAIQALRPDLPALAELDRRGVVASAPGAQHDFVSRAFYPALGIPEDPVTGSAHAQLTPYWAARLGKDQLRARQLSARGGEIGCALHGNRVVLRGQAVTFLRGHFVLP